MSAPTTPSGRTLIHALEVQRTPQGTLHVGGEQVVLERTGSGRVQVCINGISKVFFFLTNI